MELKTTYAILISTLIASASLPLPSSAQHGVIESVMMVLAQPDSRIELQALFI